MRKTTAIGLTVVCSSRARGLIGTMDSTRDETLLTIRFARKQRGN
jgi:hypothetical protein